MSSASCPSLDLVCRPSRWLQGSVLVLMFAALFAVQRSSLPWPALLLPVLLGLRAWRLASRGDGATLRFGGDGSLRHLLGGESRSARLLSAADRGPLLVLSLRIDRPAGAAPAARARHTGTVLRQCFGPDTSTPEQRRHLRLWLQRHRGDGDPFALPGAR